VKCILNRVEIRRLTWPLQNNSLLLPPIPGLRLLYVWVIVHFYYEALPNQLCSICLNLDREYITSEFSWLFLSSVTSSLNTSNPVSVGAHPITTPPCFTDDTVCFRSWAVSNVLHTFFFMSFWYRLIQASQIIIFQKWSGLVSTLCWTLCICSRDHFSWL